MLWCENSGNTDVFLYLDHLQRRALLMGVVFRVFPVELEFRGFIYARKLTAITQYNEMCFFPELSRLKVDIVEKLKKCVETVINKVPLKNFVVDLVLSPPNRGADKLQEDELSEDNKNIRLGPETDLNIFEVIIIELNPMAEFAGTVTDFSTFATP